MRGAGADIWGTADQLQFAYRQVSGDVDVTARVASIENVDGWTKTGVMIRASLAANSAQATMILSAGNGYAYQRRPTTGGATVSTTKTYGAAPGWVRLQRRGSTITAFKSTDGTSWTTVGTETLTLPATFYVGLAVSSHVTTRTAAVVFDNVAVTTSGVANQPPSVSMTAPANGATFTAPATVTMTASASDTDGTVSKVDFFANGTLIGSDTSAPYSFAWSVGAAGSYALSAVATDNTGATAASAAVNVTVSAANQVPTVSVTSPSTGASYTAPATVTVNATATDSDGMVSRVDFYANGTAIGSATTAPYGVTWSNVGAGTYSLTAVARDNTGASTTSAAVNIAVVAANQAPAVSLSAPANGATYTAPASVTVSATASDSDGTISRVDFYANGTAIGSSTAAPYSVAWNNVAAGSYSLTAIARDNAGASTTSAARSITVGAATGLPSGWSNGDIGSPSPAGSTTYASNAFTVRGAGADIWGTSDQLQFAYRQVSGDVDVIARVVSIENVDGWTKTGVMIRGSLAANAAHATMMLSAGNGYVYQRRATTGGTTVSTAKTSGAAPGWVRVQRRGTTITAFRSTDGTTWTTVGTETLTLPATFYVGLAVSSHVTSRTASTVFDNVAVTTSTATNQPPTVSVTAPANGATFTAPATVTVTASASDSDGTVSKVDFFANGTLIGTDTTAPYSLTWNVAAAGSYSVSAVATDNAGATAPSAAVSITVSSTPTNQAPAVSLTAPANGATYTAPASVTVTATASDSDGTISRVDFYANGTQIGSATASPYSVTWTNAAAGSYSLTAVARDNAGATTTSAARSITVSGAAQPPTVSLTAPASGATFTAPASVTVSASASDSDGTIARVDFYQGSTLIGSDTSSPYSITWSNVPAGTYSLVAIATDNSGSSTTSGARSITVSAPAMPDTAVFTASADNAAVVRYNLEIFTAGADPSTATPVASQDLGKPAVVNGECSVDVSTTIASLPAGNYVATVSAVGSAGSSRSAPSPTFSR